MTLRALFGGGARQAVAECLYEQLVMQARQPAFYGPGGVPDTVAGRWEMIQLHAYLLFRRLKADHAQTAEVAQRVFDTMFADVDRNMRELGVGDLGVGKKVKRWAKGFYGRVQAYDAGLDSAEPQTLEQAVARNVFAGAAPAEGAAMIATYVRGAADRLSAQPTAALLDGTVDYGPAPEWPREARSEAQELDARDETGPTGRG
jgi:cytochrome b pre-mRNA-processing protein 3